MTLVRDFPCASVVYFQDTGQTMFAPTAELARHSGSNYSKVLDSTLLVSLLIASCAVSQVLFDETVAITCFVYLTVHEEYVTWQYSLLW